MILFMLVINRPRKILDISDGSDYSGILMDDVVDGWHRKICEWIFYN
jgi:hypothetical protein